MPDYLRVSNDRIILVRPTKWDGKVEVPPWDCLDITEHIIKQDEEFYVNHICSFLVKTNDEVQYINAHYSTEIADEIDKNYKLYRSHSFSKKYSDNGRMLNPYFGCCVVAAEVLYFLTPEVYNPRCYRALDNDGIYHWWIECSDGGNETLVLDNAIFQFDTDNPPPYHNGKKTTFMGWKQSPSKRTLDLIERIIPSSTRYRTTDKNYLDGGVLGTLHDFL